ncbi:MAG: hypothetical protein A3F84_22685 [Candidatus Handelsmanbacteria bacterium RIFCSPLOWO2_12_FULL_64_10]|uniref:Uncharacterized protein n=1 Tax=Handelsmanbacteria sp. (strain RIFCSPLOWO2_12_FULL_64_10) TaxID=1817868 RepID=A0A1F6C4U1_HANXR|nr:MAG: hypothetical protein A3F84_22685 [Candidatus Handelsmanbacteria bacterium RIFCSPLOWO2_12_FULL_64_10]
MKRSKTTRRRTPISKATSPAKIGEFWDTHDFTDFEDRCPDVTDKITVDIQTIRHYVALDPDLAQKAIQVAHKRGLSAESLVNLWIKDGVEKASKK